jgi:hypothetical protein
MEEGEVHLSCPTLSDAGNLAGQPKRDHDEWFAPISADAQQVAVGQPLNCYFVVRITRAGATQSK